MNKVVRITEPTNGAKDIIEMSAPYAVEFTIKGSSDILFHRWNPDAVDAKGKAAKGSKAKKSDDTESYVYRNEGGELCIPGEYVRMSMVRTAKFRSDPRSPRKSAEDLFKAAIVPVTFLAGLGTKTWDYEDRRRVVVQRNGINRTRPAFRVGWKVSFTFEVVLPEYVGPDMFREVLSQSGRVTGIGDFRPTFGRFIVDRFKVL